MKKTIFIIILTLLLTSCSHKLVGEWNVIKYQTTKPGETDVILSNIGTMKFKSNNEGEKNLDYTVLSLTKKDIVPFTWEANEKYVTITSKNSDFAKTWIILESERNSQIWKSTNGENEVQTLELTK